MYLSKNLWLFSWERCFLIMILFYAFVYLKLFLISGNEIRPNELTTNGDVLAMVLYAVGVM